MFLEVEDRVQIEARGRLGGRGRVEPMPADVTSVGLSVGRAVAAHGGMLHAAGGPGCETTLAAAGQAAWAQPGQV